MGVSGETLHIPDTQYVRIKGDRSLSTVKLKIPYTTILIKIQLSFAISPCIHEKCLDWNYIAAILVCQGKVLSTLLGGTTLVWT